MVFVATLLVSMIPLCASLLWSKAPEADILQFFSYPWGAYQTIPRPQNSFSSDGISFYYVFFSFARDMIRSGELPLWNPYMYAGAPFLANPQSAVFYPYSVFVYLLPLNTGITLLFIANLVTAGFGMYLLLRRGFGFTLFASLFGGFSWMFSGSVMGFLHYSNSNVLAWLPLILFFADRLASTGRARYLFYFAFSFSASILGGHAEVTGVVGLVAVAYFLTLALAQYRKERSLSALFERNGMLILACLLGIALASIQLLPSVEYAQLSYRLFLYGKARALGTSFAFASTIDLRDIPTLLYPDVFASPLFNYYYMYKSAWLGRTYAAYAGIIAIALAPLGFRYRGKDVRTIFFLCALGVSLWYVFQWPLKPKLIYLLPLLENVGAPNLMYIVCFCFVVLGSFSLNTLLSLRSAAIINIRRLLVSDLICFVAATGVLMIQIANDNALRSMIESSPSAILPLKVFSPLSFENYLSFLSIEVVLSLSILTGGIVVLHLLIRRDTARLPRFMLQCLLIFLVLSNLLFYAIPFNSQADYSLAYPPTRMTDFISNSVGGYRIAPLQQELALNSPTQFRIQSVTGYDTLTPVTYGQLAAESLFAAHSGGVTNVKGIKSTVLDVLGAKFFVVDPNSELPEGYDDLTLGASSLASSQVLAELHSGTSIGQCFIASDGNLTKISVAVATGGRVYTRSSGSTSSLVREGVEGAVLYSDELDNAKIRGDTWLNFTFPTVEDSQGKEFCFWLTSNSTVGQGLFPWYYPINQNPGTELFVNGTSAVGSLVYQTYYRVGTPTNLTLVYSGEDGKVYRNNLAYPRAFMVYQYVQLSDDTEIVKLLNSPDFDSRNIVILKERLEPFVADSRAASQGLANITEYTPNRVTIKVSTPSAGFLLLTDQYYPGWQAFVNNKETKIFQADYAFRAILIPPGESTVTFLYHPESFVEGASITAVALVCSMLFLAFKYHSERAAPKRDSSLGRRSISSGGKALGFDITNRCPYRKHTFEDPFLDKESYSRIH